MSLCELQSKTEHPAEARKTAHEITTRFPDQAARVAAACGP
jgi:hypothetical protein